MLRRGNCEYYGGECSQRKNSNWSSWNLVRDPPSPLSLCLVVIQLETWKLTLKTGICPPPLTGVKDVGENVNGMLEGNPEFLENFIVFDPSKAPGRPNEGARLDEDPELPMLFFAGLFRPDLISEENSLLTESLLSGALHSDEKRARAKTHCPNN